MDLTTIYICLISICIVLIIAFVHTLYKGHEIRQLIEIEKSFNRGRESEIIYIKGVIDNTLDVIKNPESISNLTNEQKLYERGTNSYKHPIEMHLKNRLNELNLQD